MQEPLLIGGRVFYEAAVMKVRRNGPLTNVFFAGCGISTLPTVKRPLKKRADQYWAVYFLPSQIIALY